jgi:hypothetical protein
MEADAALRAGGYRGGTAEMPALQVNVYFRFPNDSLKEYMANGSCTVSWPIV